MDKGEKEPIIVRTQPGHSRCAEHVAGFLRKLGHDVKVVGETALEVPIEIAFESLGAAEDR